MSSKGVTVTAFNRVVETISPEANEDAENNRGMSIPLVSVTTAVYWTRSKPPLVLEGLETSPKFQVILNESLVN